MINHIKIKYYIMNMFISVNFHTYMTSQKVAQNPLKIITVYYIILYIKPLYVEK